jgi:hypothetical protein
MPTILRKAKTGAKAGSKSGNDVAIQDPEVDAAVHRLEQGVHKRLSKWTMMRNQNRARSLSDNDLVEKQSEILRVLAHVRHCWTNLRRHLTVLSAGMQCFVEKLLPSFYDHIVSIKKQGASLCSDGAKVVSCKVVGALQHMFQSLLRLHDGYILTVSGECRHAADIAVANQITFRSQLNLPGKETSDNPAEGSVNRNNGLSGSTYSAASTYSGTSWDEWFDPRRGLLRRLHSCLRPFINGRQKQDCGVFWEEWSELGRPGAPLEALIVDTELRMKAIQSQFTSLRQAKFANTIEQALRRTDQADSVKVNVTLEWRDKMEQLIVLSSITGGKVKLERYADRFQVKTRVLPAEYISCKQWWSQEGIRWQSDAGNAKAGEKRKRRIIVEYNAENGAEGNTKNVKAVRVASEHDPVKGAAVATGIVVKVLAADNNYKCETPLQSSINCIKQQYGVDVASMENAFDNVMVEEADTMREAELVDNAPEDSIFESDEMTSVAKAKLRVKEWKRNLRRAIDNVDCNDIENAYNVIWNTRDKLRQVTMQAGQLALHVAQLAQEDGDVGDVSETFDGEQMLLLATRYFKAATRLIAEQEKLFGDMNDGTTANCYQRNLLLLRGRALVNCGITSIELARQNEQNQENRLQAACKLLDDAAASARALREPTTNYSVDEDDIPLGRVESLEAMELESLAFRWKATALWYLRRIPEAYETFVEASSAFTTEAGSSLNVACTHSEIVAMTNCWMQCYDAMTTLADFALKSMKQATLFQVREFPATYKTLLDMVDTAISTSASISTAIHQAHSTAAEATDRSLLREILTSVELSQYWNEVLSWWENLTELATTNMLDHSKNSDSQSEPQQRSDLEPFLSFSVRTKTFLVEAQKRRKSKYNLGGSGFSNVGASIHRNGTRHRQPRKFRKWREDMVLDAATGRLAPKLTFPSIAPDMPPHIASILARKVKSQAVTNSVL